MSDIKIHKSIAPQVVTIITASAMAIAMVTGLLVLWEFMYSYDEHSPDKRAGQFLQMLIDEDYEDFLIHSSYETDELNGRTEYEKYLKHCHDENIRCEFLSEEGNNRIYSVANSEGEILRMRLKPDGKENIFGHTQWKVMLENLPKDNDIRLYVPAMTKVKVNGAELSDKYMQTDFFPIVQYSDINNVQLIPKYKIYYVDKLLNAPQVMSEYNGIETEFLQYSNGNEYIAYIPPTDEVKAEAEKILLDTAHKYTEFSTKHIKFVDMMPYLMEGTELYKKLKSAEREDFGEYKLSYEDEMIENLHFYDDTHFSADVKYTYNLSGKKDEQSFDICYRMAFIRINNEWRLAELISEN